MNLKPLGDRILVKLIMAEEKTASGIVLPDSVEKEKKAEGEVMAIGNGEKVKTLGLTAGQKVVFGKYSGEDFGKDDEYKFLKHDEVLAIIE